MTEGGNGENPSYPPQLPYGPSPTGRGGSGKTGRKPISIFDGDLEYNTATVEYRNGRGDNALLTLVIPVFHFYFLTHLYQAAPLTRRMRKSLYIRKAEVRNV
jgi:hypothetical protein